MAGGAALSGGVQLIISNRLMLERPRHPGQWRSVQNLPVQGDHISALHIKDNNLSLFMHSTSSGLGANYKGYMMVVMAPPAEASAKEVERLREPGT